MSTSEVMTGVHMSAEKLQSNTTHETKTEMDASNTFDTQKNKISSSLPLATRFYPVDNNIHPSRTVEAKDEENENLQYPVGRRGNCRYFTANPYPSPLRSTKRKRNSKDEQSGPVKRRREIRPEYSTPGNKLDIICPGLLYEYSEGVGPPHQPTFEVSVLYTPNGKAYKEFGRSKKAAKHAVALKILQDIGSPYTPPTGIDLEDQFADRQLNLINAHGEFNPEMVSSSQNLISPKESEIDFTTDDFPVLRNKLPNIPEIPIPAAGESLDQRVKMLFKKLSKVDLVGNPSAALHTICAGEGGECVCEVLPIDRDNLSKGFEAIYTFIIPPWLRENEPVSVEGTSSGTGLAKKVAKAEAARRGLVMLIGPELYNKLATSTEGRAASLPKEVAEMYIHHMGKEVDQNFSLAFAQEMAMLVFRQFNDLLKMDDVYYPHKVLAGVVMTLGFPLIENMHVVCITTGTKCISGDFLSDKGLGINDCHAEILAVRCVRDFLYSQIEAHASLKGEEKVEGSNILERLPNTPDGVKKFKLKQGVLFHLFISTSPCGDARIFSPKGLDLTDDEISCPPGEEIIDTSSNKANRSLLRAKIESGEGTIAVSNLTASGLQTWDAILSGNPLYTMSCSDKLCRMNVLGIQGALLSILLEEPIYFSSILLGSLHHPTHFERAMFARIANLENVKPPFRINNPRLLMVADTGKRRVKKSPNHSVAWICSWNSYERLSSSKGRCQPAGLASRLSKRLAFTRFLKLYKNETGARADFLNISYADAKKLAINYQETKQTFKDFMSQSGFGNWISKPQEQDEFYL